LVTLSHSKLLAAIFRYQTSNAKSHEHCNAVLSFPYIRPTCLVIPRALSESAEGTAGYSCELDIEGRSSLSATAKITEVICNGNFNVVDDDQ